MLNVFSSKANESFDPTGLIILAGVIVVVLIVFICHIRIVKQAEKCVVERLGSYHTTWSNGIHFLFPILDKLVEVETLEELEVRRLLLNVEQYNKKQYDENGQLQPCDSVDENGQFLQYDNTGRLQPYDVTRRYHKYHKMIDDKNCKAWAKRLGNRNTRITLKEQVLNIEPQSVITKDNVKLDIDTVVFIQVTDAKAYCYGVVNPLQAVIHLCVTTLRSVIGSLDLDEVLSSRDSINRTIRMMLDEATDHWGIKVNRVEVQEINPPHSIKEAMEKQMRAEREKRATILIAEGEKQAAILRAEGEKQAAILQAEGEKEHTIRVAEGEAKSVRLRKEAEALGITLTNEAQATHETIQLRALDTLSVLANGQATKIIVPSELQNLTSILASVNSVKDDN